MRKITVKELRLLPEGAIFSRTPDDNPMVWYVWYKCFENPFDPDPWWVGEHDPLNTKFGYACPMAVYNLVASPEANNERFYFREDCDEIRGDEVFYVHDEGVTSK